MLTVTPKVNINYPSFGSQYGNVYGKEGLQYRTNTFFFRNDISWDEFVSFLADKYKNTKHVHVVNHACSDGEEPVSLVIKLLDSLGEKAKKFFPIWAKDLDASNIEKAKLGQFSSDEIELSQAKCLLSKNIKEYVDISFENWLNISVKPKDIVTQNIKYKQSNIMSDMKNLPRKNTVVLCRNFWPYLSDKDIHALAKRLSQYLDSSCMVVVGEYDIENGIDKIFKKYDFKPTHLYNVFIPNGKGTNILKKAIHYINCYI